MLNTQFVQNLPLMMKVSGLSCACQLCTPRHAPVAGATALPIFRASGVVAYVSRCANTPCHLIAAADRIVASADECQGHWQQKDYKSFSPGSDWWVVAVLLGFELLLPA